MNKKGIPEGRRGVLVEDFIAVFEKHFEPKKVKFDFWIEDDEDDAVDCSIRHLRVYNDDNTFQLYDHDSKPSIIDLMNDIFGMEDESPIVNYEFGDSIITMEESNEKHDEIIKKYDLPKESYAAVWKDKADDDENCRLAWKEWGKWLWNKTSIFFLYEIETIQIKPEKFNQ